MRSKNGRSAGLDGTGLSFPSHSTNRGAFGSPNTKSSFSPLSTCARAPNPNPFSISRPRKSPRKRSRWGRKRGAYGHGEDGLGGLEAVGPLLPEVPFLGALDGGDVAAGAGAGLRDEHVADAVLRGQRLRGAEAADAAAHHDAVRGHPRARGGRRLGGAARHRGAAYDDAAAAEPRGAAGPAEWRHASGRGGGHGGGGDHFRRLCGAGSACAAEWMTRHDVVLRGWGWPTGMEQLGLGIAFPRVIGSVDIQIRHVLQ
jgi:hypothetical protein